MKKTPQVAAAEAAVKAKAKELAEAKAIVERLTREHAEALAAVRSAQEAADSERPQARLVRVSWHSGTVRDDIRMVIERRTPTGMLVVRRVGIVDGEAERFKWDGHAGKFVQAEARAAYSDRCELRDVPAEYDPPRQSA